VEKPSTSPPSPHSPTRWTANAFSWQRSLAVFVAAALAFYLGLMLNSLIAFKLLGTTAHDVTTNHLTWGIAVGQYVSYVPILAVLVFGLPWASGTSLRELGLRGFDGKTIRAGLLGAVAMYVTAEVFALLQYQFTHQKPEEAALSLFNSTHDRALIAAFTLLATIVAPFMEEFFFRGFLFNAFVRYLPFWAAAVISGAIFGLAHGSATAFLPLAASGVVLAYVYYRSGSLTASMITHAVFNIVNVALLSVQKT
jgi:membrane protease YdiL (CAAX protease family)